MLCTKEHTKTLVIVSNIYLYKIIKIKYINLDTKNIYNYLHAGIKRILLGSVRAKVKERRKERKSGSFPAEIAASFLKLVYRRQFFQIKQNCAAFID